MGFKAIYNENAPKNLKLKQRVSSVRNLQSNNDKEIIINNQQSKTFEKQTEDIFNKAYQNHSISRHIISFQNQG